MSAIENVEINSYCFTHVGKVRKENEDSLKLWHPMMITLNVRTFIRNCRRKWAVMH